MNIQQVLKKSTQVDRFFRRKNWHRIEYIEFKFIGFENIAFKKLINIDGLTDHNFTIDDLMASDWEVVKAP